MKQGIGLVAMRERSELMGGRIVFSIPPAGGTLLRLTAPRDKIEVPDPETHSTDHEKNDNDNNYNQKDHRITGR